MIKKLHFTRSLALAALAIFILIPGLWQNATLFNNRFAKNLIS